MQTVEISANGDAVQVGEAIFPLIWLRHNCPSAFHPQTQERVLDLLDLPDVPELTHAAAAGGALELTWADGHGSRFQLDWLLAHAPGQRGLDPAAVPPVTWRADLGAAGVPRHQADAILESDDALLAWLRETKAYGLSIVDGMPQSAEAGVLIGRRISFLRETNFGTTFEVVSKPDPNNLAYTSEALPLHTDLPNQELPPGYQFLQCLANDAEGGGSIFADGFAAAEDLAVEAPEDYDVLARTPVPFRFHDREVDLRARRPILRLDHDGQLAEVTHSPHITDIFDMPADEMAAFYKVFRRWLVRLNDPAYKLTLRLAAGEMVVFDNRRVLHGRARFDPGTGFRHLHGFYVDRQDLDSRIRVMVRGGGEGREG